jgi:hypothetical protein
MYPEDRVLIAYLPEPADFEIIRNEGWYRIPEKHAPKGLHAEYFAFYFGRKFEKQKWAIHYYARQRGHELVKRIVLFPDDRSHPRALENYYKVALGRLEKLDQPILSLRWRRITFMHTTWDRFQDAREIGDLFIMGGEYVDRIFSALKERGIPVERDRKIEEAAAPYNILLSILCLDGWVDITQEEIIQSEGSQDKMIDEIVGRIKQQGGAKEKS